MNDDPYQNQPLLNSDSIWLYLRSIDKNYIDDDERKSLAIINLQAMLQIEDVD